MLDAQRMTSLSGFDEDPDHALIQLAGLVSHELSNIFTSLAGNLSILETELTGEQQAILCDLMRVTRRGIDLTAKLQAFAGQV